MTNHDAEMEAIVAELEKAGLVEAYTGAVGREAGQALFDALFDGQDS